MFLERNGDVAEYHMESDGRIYFFNSGLKHWVKNNSPYDRLHLIVDVHGQRELDELEPIIF
jgi:aspartyl/asparaginyl beta-hydroxylase (cupin superfamily)